MTLLTCSDGLIGDFLGILPVMMELAKQDELHINIHPEAGHIFHLIPKKYNIKIQDKEPVFYDRILELDICKAFDISNAHNYYMSQSHFAYLGLPVPEKPPKAELEFDLIDVPVCDYIIAPFSRSLPPEQRWPQQQWQQLINAMSDRTFCIIGHDRDERDFVSGNNVFQMYNEPLVKVVSVLKNAEKGLISVVSGPSHLAFHLNVKNYLLANQSMTWGINPRSDISMRLYSGFESRDNGGGFEPSSSIIILVKFLFLKNHTYWVEISWLKLLMIKRMFNFLLRASK